MNRVDRDLALLMAEHNGAKHDFFAQLLGLGFDHQDSRFGASNHQVEHRVLARGLTRIEHVFTVDVAHAGSTDRAAERDAADGQGRADSNQGRNISIDFRIERQRVHDNVHFVEKTFREQRTDRAVDQAAG